MAMPHCPPARLQDIALVESSPATFQSPYKQDVAPTATENPRQCVLLRAGGHLSVLDMDQGAPNSPCLIQLMQRNPVILSP